MFTTPRENSGFAPRELSTRLIIDVNLAVGNPALPTNWQSVRSVRLVAAHVFGVAVTAGVPNVDYLSVNIGKLGGTPLVRGAPTSTQLVIPLTGATTSYVPGAPIELLTPQQGINDVADVNVGLLTPAGATVTTADVRRVMLELAVDYAAK